MTAFSLFCKNKVWTFIPIYHLVLSFYLLCNNSPRVFAVQSDALDFPRLVFLVKLNYNKVTLIILHITELLWSSIHTEAFEEPHLIKWPSVVSTAASQHQGFWFEPHLETSSVEFFCGCVGSFVVRID